MIDKDRDAQGRLIKGTMLWKERRHSGRLRKSETREFIRSFQDIIDQAIPEEKWLAIVTKMADQAEAGDSKAAMFLAEHRFGRPLQRQDVTVTPGGFTLEQAIAALTEREQQRQARLTTGIHEETDVVNAGDVDDVIDDADESVVGIRVDAESPVKTQENDPIEGEIVPFPEVKALKEVDITPLFEKKG